MFTGVLGQDISIGEKYSSHALAKANRLANILHKTVIRADWRGSSVAGSSKKSTQIPCISLCYAYSIKWTKSCFKEENVLKKMNYSLC